MVKKRMRRIKKVFMFIFMGIFAPILIPVVYFDEWISNVDRRYFFRDYWAMMRGK